MPGLPGAPLGLAFFAAIRAAGIKTGAAFVVAVAVVLGAFSAPEGTAWLSALLGLAGAHALAVALRLGKRGSSPLGAAVIAGLGAVAPSLVAQWVGGYDQLAAVRVLFQVSLSAVLALLFCQAVSELLTGRGLYQDGLESPFPVIAVAGAALCGLVGMAPVFGYVLPWEFAASLLVMVSAHAGGWTAGAAAGGVLGLAYLVRSIADLGAAAPGNPSFEAAAVQTVGYVLAGMLSGAFREFRWWGVAVSFSLVHLLYFSMALPEHAHLTSLFVSVGSAALLLVLIPSRWLANVPAVLLGPTSGDPGPAAQPAHGGPALVSDRVRGLSRVLREVLRTLEQVAAFADPKVKEADDTTGALCHAVDRVCRTCSMHGHCWQKETARTRQALADVWSAVRSDEPSLPDSVVAELERFCIYSKEIIHTYNHLHDLDRTHRYWERRFEEGRRMVGDHLRNITQILDRLGAEVFSLGLRELNQAAPVLQLNSGVAKMARRGTTISGDSYASEEVGAEQHLLVLSDGMGGGQKASLESRQCVNLLRQLIGTGFRPESAVQTVNSALMLRSPEDSFTTVDLALVDLYTGQAEFIKVGAPPSFLVRGGDVTVIRSEGVPIGILDRVEMEPEMRNLRPGDLLVMVTDGLWEIARDDVDKERWLIDHLRRARSQDPEELAESLLARALELAEHEGNDDMTVLVASVEMATGQEGRRRSAPVQWAIAKLAPRRRPMSKG